MTGEGRVHPDCRNASNPYHVCSDYCFIIIAEAKARNNKYEAGMFRPLYNTYFGILIAILSFLFLSKYCSPLYRRNIYSV